MFRYVDEQKLFSHWRRLGIELKLSQETLDIIEDERTRVADRAASMLNAWLKSSEATKQALIEAVQRMVK